MGCSVEGVYSLTKFYQEVRLIDSDVIQRNISRLSQEDRNILSIALRVMGQNSENAGLSQLWRHSERFAQIVAQLKDPKEFCTVKKIRNFFNHIRLGLGIFSKNYLQSASLASEIEAFKKQFGDLRKKYSDPTDQALSIINSSLYGLRRSAREAKEAAFTTICIQEGVEIYDTDSSGTVLGTGRYTDGIYEQGQPDRYIDAIREYLKEIREQIQKPGISEADKVALEDLCQKYEQFAAHPDLKQQNRNSNFERLYQALRRNKEESMIEQRIRDRMKPEISMAVIEQRLPSLQGAAKEQAERDLEFLKALL